ncbi:hypothetical protein OAL35_01470 [bacterium]|nr:hypothetical protein [bacterium]
MTQTEHHEVCVIRFVPETLRAINSPISEKSGRHQQQHRSLTGRTTAMERLTRSSRIAAAAGIDFGNEPSQQLHDKSGMPATLSCPSNLLEFGS